MRKKRTYDIVLISFTAALLAVCSWITVPAGAVPFTMQTFGVFVAALLLGEIKGTVSVIVYILLGAVGLPVFSSFQSGVGVILGATGGYLLGFVFITLIGGFFSRKFSDNTVLTFLGLTLGLIVCYVAGTAWFMIVYLDSAQSVSVLSVLASCVFPYILPDIVKMALAVAVAKKVKGRIL